MKKSFIQEIANWKLEAKLEDVDRYFFHTDEVQEILSGRKAYVIGRKGTGKTAISEYIYRNPNHAQFTEKLSFKNFPFNELYSLKNESFNFPNQYITIWKYLIYSSVCRMMIRNESLDNDIRTSLGKVFTPDPIISLSRTISKWTTGEFGFQILGNGVTVKLGTNNIKPETPISERVAMLEDIIIKFLDSSSYFVIFDELDEDYKDILLKSRNEEYFHLLTSLFKAVQDVRSIFGSVNHKIFPVIFLRDDIYDFLRDADKNKWKDFQVGLEWDSEKIQKLLAFRISRAINQTGPILAFDDAWNNLMASDGGVRIGNEQNREIPKFQYIARSTYLRPRDFIRFLQVSAQEEINCGSIKIRAATLKQVDKAFSNYLRDEVIDEVYAIIPEIEQVFDIFSQIRKQTFTQEIFREMYSQRAQEEGFRIKDPDYVLRILFHFSVIGNQPRQHNTMIFQYLNKDARLNRFEKVVIHRGLFKALGIV